MAIEIISGEEVYKTVISNKLKRWPGRNNPDRLFPIATPIGNATFKIKPDDKIFCIGSCFASEISNALHRQNYEVLSIFRDLPKSPNRHVDNENIIRKYNVASIYNELKWALDSEGTFPVEKVLI
ncbi:hypothetical protein JCM14076_27170 [Methylosoma difficile]